MRICSNVSAFSLDFRLCIVCVSVNVNHMNEEQNKTKWIVVASDIGRHDV